MKIKQRGADEAEGDEERGGERFVGGVNLLGFLRRHADRVRDAGVGGGQRNEGATTAATKTSAISSFTTRTCTRLSLHVIARRA